MLIGLIGTVVPILPGLMLIWAAFLGFGFYDHFEAYGRITLIISGIVVAMSLVLDFLASSLGAKKFGAGKAGMIGSIVFALIGLVIFSLPGLIIGTFLGAVVFEMIFNQKDFKQSLTAGLGAFLGFLCGSLFKFMIGAILTGTFVWFVVKHWLIS
jgi:uncharacterized protein YqgC (DUF456 family)